MRATSGPATMRDFRFELANDEVHVWGVPLHSQNIDTEALRSILSSEELVRAARFQSPKLRDAFMITRGMLKVMLGRYLDTQPENIRMSYGPNGKPEWLNRGSLEFNVSHSADLALLAFARDCDVGVDIENLQALPDPIHVASQVFENEETAELAQLPPDERGKAFYQCWTRKEAFIKATGRGFSMPLDSFRVTLDPKVPPRLLRIGSDDSEVSFWTLADLAMPNQYVASIAYRATERRLQFNWISGWPES